MTETEPKISWEVVTKFIRQLNHDLRNHLNAVELQLAFLNEIAAEAEIKAELKRLRDMTGELGGAMQRLSNSLKTPRPQLIGYRAKDFLEDLRAKISEAQPELAKAVEWRDSLGEAVLEIDPPLLLEAFKEIFANAAEHGRADGRLTFEAASGHDAIEFTLREPKKKFEGVAEEWGTRPLGVVGQGHYGLGLFRARGILEAHGGTLRAQFDPAASVLVTTVCLPRCVS